MIPNWYATTIWLGPIPIQVWGLFVALGFAVAIWLMVKRAPRAGLDPKHVVDFAAWAIVASMVGARFMHVFAYEPAYYLAHPMDIVKFWEGGLSSFGGFLGALIAAIIFLRLRRLPFMRFTDLALGVLPIGFAIGRLGCHFTRMHPGPACSNAFCFLFPDAARRLDTGFLEAMLWAAIAMVVYRARKFLAIEGRMTAAVIGCYGIGRFTLDFLRVEDSRYLGLTPAQYGCMMLLVIAAMLLMRARRTT